MSTGKIELSVGAVKITNKYELLTEEEIHNIDDKIPELEERVGVVEDELEQSVKFKVVGEGTTVPPINGGSSYTLPIATKTRLGGVKIGNNLSIDSNGVLSATTSDYDDTEIREMINETNTSLDNKTNYIKENIFKSFKQKLNDDTLALKETLKYVIENNIGIIELPKGEFNINERFIIDEKYNNITIHGNGTILNITNLPILLEPFMTFTNCKNVTLDNVTIKGKNHYGQANEQGTVASVIKFDETTENCAISNCNISGIGTDIDNMIGHGLVFASKNGKCFGNKFKNTYGFGVIVIHYTDDSVIEVYENTCINTNNSYQAGYKCRNIKFYNNKSFNPRVDHFLIECSASPSTVENSYTAYMENIKIINNECFGGNYGATIKFRDKNSPQNHIKNISIKDNLFDNCVMGVSIRMGYGKEISSVSIENNIVKSSNDTSCNFVNIYTTNDDGSVAILNDINIIKNTVISANGSKKLINVRTDTKIDNLNILDNTFINNNCSSDIISFDSGKNIYFYNNKFIDNKQNVNIRLDYIDMLNVNNNIGLKNILSYNNSNYKSYNNDILTNENFYRSVEKNSTVIKLGEKSATINNNYGKKIQASDVQYTFTTNGGDIGTSWVTVTDTNIVFNVSNATIDNLYISYTIMLDKNI